MHNRFKIFRDLLSYSTMSFYNISEKNNLFLTGNIIRIEWTKHFAVLSVFFKDNQNFVLESTEQKYLITCNGCGISDKNCKHYMAVMCLIKHFLTQEKQKKLPYSEREQQLLQYQLLYEFCVDNSFPSQSQSEISICIIPKFNFYNNSSGNPCFVLMKNGKVMIPEEYKTIPELEPFLTINIENSEQKFMQIIPNLTRYPLYVYDQDALCSIIWDNVGMYPFIEISILKKNKVSVRCLAKYGNTILSNIISIGKFLFVDKEEGKIGLILHHNWNIAFEWRMRSPLRLQRAPTDFPNISEPFEIPIDMFNETALCSHAVEDLPFVFKYNDAEIKPTIACPEAKINIFPSDQQSSILKAHIYFNKIRIEPFDTSDLEKLVKNRGLGRKYFERRMAVLWKKAYCAASCAKDKEELDKIIEETSLKILEEYPSVDIKKELKHLLKAHIKKYKVKRITLIYL